MSHLTPPDLDALFERRHAQLYEVPDLMENDFPIGVAWLVAVAQSRRVTVPDLADIAGRPVDQTKQSLAMIGVRPDESGVLVDSGPDETVMPRYQVHWLDTGEDSEVPGCSSDALLGVIASRRPAFVRLSNPWTAQLIELCFDTTGRLEEVRPAGAVAVMPSPADWHPRDWSRSQCADGLLFDAAEAASGWLADHPGNIAVPTQPFVRHQRRILAAMGYLDNP